MLRIQLPVAIAAILLHSTILFAEEIPAPPAHANLRPISQSDIRAAVREGRPIMRRSMLGSDLSLVLQELIDSRQKCDSGRKLQIESSVIAGDVVLEISAEDSDYDTEYSFDDDNKVDHREPSHTLAIPIAIVKSSIGGGVRFSKLALPCNLDLSGSTLEDTFRIERSTFAGAVTATSATFENGMVGIGVTWSGAAVFKRAKFRGNVELIGKSVFGGRINFREAVFSRVAHFIKADFKGHASFRHAQFMRGANFTDAQIGPDDSKAGPFYMAEFAGLGNFRNTRFTGLTFRRTAFRSGVDFHGAQGKTLYFQEATLAGPSNFDDTVIGTLEFNNSGGSMILDGDAIFRRAEFEQLSFVSVALRKAVDFQSTRVKSRLNLETVAFEGDVYLQDTVFPQKQDQPGAGGNDDKSEFAIKDVTFAKGIYSSSREFLADTPWWAIWREDRPRFHDPEAELDTKPKREDFRRLWRELEKAFAAGGNIELKNYATYQVRRSAEADEDRFSRTWSTASRWFWGYGVRPLRVAGWLAAFLVVFAAVYWTQLGGMSGPLARARQSIAFSWRTAWEWKYGYEHSATSAFRAITFAQSMLGKILLACLVYSMTQASPLLSELVKKLLPG